MSIQQMDLNLFVVLDAVLSERSVVRAAKRLHVTPSAVSNALARLRGMLGDPIVMRSGRGIVPTPRAEELGPRVARLLGELEQLAEGPAFDVSQTTRSFTLATADSAQLVRLPSLAQRLSERMPRARLRVVGIDTLLSSGGLAGTEVDAAIVSMPEVPLGVRVQKIGREEAVLIARRGHPHLGERASRVALGAVAHVDVEIAPGRGYRGLSERYAQAGIGRTVALVVPSFTTAVAIVAETDLVSTVPASLVEVVAARYGVRRVTTPVAKLTVDVQLAWHDRTENDPAMRAFRGLILKEPTTKRRRGPRPR